LDNILSLEMLVVVIFLIVRTGTGRIGRSIGLRPSTVAALVVSLSTAGAVRPVVCGPPGFTDVHSHLVPVRGDFEGAIRAALERMDERGIGRMVVMPTPMVSGHRGRYDVQDCGHLLRRHAARLAYLGGGGTLNPMLQDAGKRRTVGDDLKRVFEARAGEILRMGARGFGEITAHHISHDAANHPYESVPADHPLLLLLADIAARNRAVIDLHLDPVVSDMALPGNFPSPPNPAVLPANIAAFERLLEHNRGAVIVWAHAGSDPLGHWTVELTRSLLARHPNLHMSLRPGRNRFPQHDPMTRFGTVKPEWLRVFQEYSDRFMIGLDQFILPPGAGAAGPGRGPRLVSEFDQRSGLVLKKTRALLAALPADVARKIGSGNAVRIYRLDAP
jgi:hypothetical protein